MHQGSCLCGAVRFTVQGDLPEASACHCSKCRKHTGHYEAGVDVPRSAVTITGEEAVTWYFSSEKVRRGFCSVCGSSLFFDPVHLDWIGLMLGSFDTPTQTRIGLHIFVADKGDYYEITDGMPQNQQ
ncbi:GFA family protein [Devosia sp. FKR38]|uniref:GFA family protein n=1 Tax=Devosia sp. FKR38 TaxID=2562312 RepID=UPI0010C074F0|nr:GFA family protein [Devosia sp. FKR38]